jgi:uncharacterized protein (TIGR02266 family)
MKTVLDLIGEFAALHDEKVRCGGTLSPGKERRWLELKNFYELLMAQNGLKSRPVTRRFSADDIRRRITSRDRLRVPAELDMVLRYQGEYQTVQVLNISRGGVFLGAETLYPVGSQLTLFVANAHRGGQALFEADGKVAWVTERGVAESDLPRGMGIRFVGSQEKIRQELDLFVIDTLERRLSGVDAMALAPDFVIREKIDL